MSYTTPTPNPDLDPPKEDSKPIPVILDDDNLSTLSDSSFDSIDKMKFKKVEQYTCDECSSIPKIINLDEKTKTITIKCEKHGIKTINLKTYLFNCLNYNQSNWKCSSCQKILRDFNETFKYCECNTVFCEPCFTMHQRKIGHKYALDSSNINLRCKKTKEHFEEIYTGFCLDCQEQFCSKCKDEHKWHECVDISTIQIEKKDVKKIIELNKEYERLISFYQSLIKLNELIIYSYDKYRNNYYNLSNINTIINNSKRNQLIESFENGENIQEENSNEINYFKELYNQDIKEETEDISINNKFLNNDDLKVLTKIPLNNLTILNLENNSLTQISCLKNCNFNNLLILNLNNNGIEDISVFGNDKFNNLQALTLRNNAIKDISVFGKKKFNSLRQLDLRNNCIEDISVFDSWKNNLESLLNLYLTNNVFDKSKNEKTIKLLEELVEFEC